MVGARIRIALVLAAVMTVAGCGGDDSESDATTTTVPAARTSTCNDTMGETPASVADMDLQKVTLEQTNDGQVTVSYFRNPNIAWKIVDGAVWTTSIIDERDNERQLVISAAETTGADGVKKLYWQQRMNELVPGGGSSRDVRTSTVEEFAGGVKATFIPAYLEGFGKISSWRASAGKGTNEEDFCPDSTQYQRF